MFDRIVIADRQILDKRRRLSMPVGISKEYAGVNQKGCTKERSGILHAERFRLSKKQVYPYVYLVLYGATAFIESTHPGANTFNGILCQIQIFLSFYLAVSLFRTGYIIAMTVNIVQSLGLSLLVFSGVNPGAAPGIPASLTTIFIISVLHTSQKRLSTELYEKTGQKLRLERLNEEISSARKQLQSQNEQLAAYTKQLSENEEKLNSLSYFDLLTELPNRLMLLSRIDLLLSHSDNQERFAVAIIDFNNFKKINDTAGYNVGDIFLVTAALRLRESIHESDFVGRLGGDEFALIIQQRMSGEEICRYMNSLQEVLKKPAEIGNVQYSTGASIGVAVYPDDGTSAEELLKYADMAMYQAKENGNSSVQLFQEQMKNEVLHQIEFENNMKSAVSNGEVFMVYQPQYDSISKQLRGFEALIRWQSPKLGFVSPLQLIAAAEKTGQIISLGEWILRKTCEDFRKITSCGNVLLSVNISAVQLMDPSFLQMVQSVLKELDFNPRRLELEVTESVFISASADAAQLLRKLKEMGIRIALDDFGTGYSSLSYLQNLPVDILKLDKSFINTLNDPDGKTEIVEDIIRLAHQMGMKVVAEGVENQDQLDYLRENGCDYIQGFLWGRPLCKKDLVVNFFPQILTEPNPEGTGMG
jgi:diguanylate cyclase (GGDEF)-like protein